MIFSAHPSPRYAAWTFTNWCHGVTGMAQSWLMSYLSRRSQSVKFGHHQSPAVNFNVDVLQGSVLVPLLSCRHCPVNDIIVEHGVQYHQYADDTQLHLAMRASNTVDGLSVLAACTSTVRLWYIQIDRQLSLDKSEVLIPGTSMFQCASEHAIWGRQFKQRSCYFHPHILH